MAVSNLYNIDPNHPDIVELRKHTKFVKFKKGEVILHPHDETNYLHVIDEGMVKIYTINAKGDQSISIIYGPRELFPLSCVIEERMKNIYFEARMKDTYFEAMTDCKIELVPKDIFIEKLKTNADVSYAFSRKVLEQFAMYASRVSNLEFKFSRERLAYRLLVLAARFGEKKDGKYVLPYISQQDLAATLNLTRESVSREMSRFERLEIIGYGDSNIILMKPDDLHSEIGKDADVMFLEQANT